MFLSYAKGEDAVDISQSAVHVSWRENPVAEDISFSVLIIIFGASWEDHEAQAALATIEEPVTFVYGPEGKAPGLEKLSARMQIQPSNSNSTIVAVGKTRIERGVFD